MNETQMGLPALPRWGLAVGLAALVAGCGGGGGGSADSAQSTTQAASAGTTVQVDAANVPDMAAQPTFHVAPVLLAAPDDRDAQFNAASAAMGPRTQSVPAWFSGLATRGLTLQTLQAADRAQALSATGGTVTPQAGAGVVATYAPAQIRAAYSLPALPAAGATPGADQAAQLGAGRTIYIVDAMHDPNVAAELAAFNQKFGLPSCASQTITSAPLAAASTSGCAFSVVYSTAGGGISSRAPSYDSGWATEIALDVQWAHATAPYARIVLIEAPSATLSSLLGAIQLANAMGPGIVSMSFGANEGNWTASVDSAFSASGMTYLAATGDAGVGVEWPAVSARVLAVGGTTLSWNGGGTRSEVAWSGSGGGVSRYTATPSYQNNAVPGMGTPTHRSVADVAFNADPYSGQYVAIQAPGSASVSWLSVGGTSISTPQWAGIVAVADALRTRAGQTALGTPHGLLYGQIASTPGSFASDFADITLGSDGNCATCSAKAGYDTVTGLGTPNVDGLLASLANSSVAPAAPVVSSATIAGNVGTPLAFTVAVDAPNAVTYALSGAPAGMAISSVGAVSWASPLAGSYSVTVTATDSVTGLSGQGLYSVNIAGPSAPLVGSAIIAGKLGTPLTFNVNYSAPDPVSFTLAGAPAGMTIDAAGAVTWPVPVAGSYRVTVTASDATTGLSGQGVYSVNIAAPSAPLVSGGSISGSPGVSLSFGVAYSASDPVAFSLLGAPAGMSIDAYGLVTWDVPVAGSYQVTVVVSDVVTGLTGQAVYTLNISDAGPVITASPMTGVAGHPLTGTILFSDTGGSAMRVSITGTPRGMSFYVRGMAVIAYWSRPVTGSYSLNVTAVDAAGLSAQASVPITITAH